MSGEVFLLDTNTLVTPYRNFYRFAFCPGFWDFVRLQFEKQETISIIKVHDEITRNNDALSAWLRRELDKMQFFDTTKDDASIAKYGEISDWLLNNPQYFEPAKRAFLGVNEADPWICAYAAVYGSTVVTEEVSRPFAQKRVPLANVLDEFNVSYINLFDFLETQKAKFVLT